MLPTTGDRLRNSKNRLPGSLERRLCWPAETAGTATWSAHDSITAARQEGWAVWDRAPRRGWPRRTSHVQPLHAANAPGIIHQQAARAASDTDHPFGRAPEVV